MGHNPCWHSNFSRSVSSQAWIKTLEMGFLFCVSGHNAFLYIYHETLQESGLG